ncbi:hypothetical protein ACFWCB_01535 [Streptomyces sp. NPDC060048]|uniref:hypothetical protein n=1 Tax=Streptomyces sp. NPDC060048 TaxID=3347045 RepID=UPI0036758A09
MNDPITLAATEHEGPRGFPDTTAARPPTEPTAGPGATSGPDDVPDAGAVGGACAGPGPDRDPGRDSDRDPDQDPSRDSEPGGATAPPEGAGAAPAEGAGAAPIRTVLETAATGRSVKEVAALVNLLKDSGQLPNPGHAALRAAAVARPVQDVHEMVALLGEPGHEAVETDITLRAAALGRPIEDVALLVGILGTGDGQAPYRGTASDPEPPGRPAARRPAPAPVPQPAPARSAGGALRHVLRWPVVFALLLCGALHVPGDMAALPSGDPDGLLALAVTLLCPTAGVLLAVRDTAGAWRTGAVVALGVAALHVVGGAVRFDPLAGAVGGTVEWAGVTAVLSAATAAVLAGLALQYRPAADPADGA